MRIIAAIIMLLIVVSSYAQPTITTETITQTSVCAGSNIVVQYTTTGTFNFGCTFTAQLSNSMGIFNSPVDIGSVPINTGIIMGVIPSNTQFGLGYRVRVVSDDPVVIGTTSPGSPIVITSSAYTATINAIPSHEACFGDSITLWATTNAAYSWSTGETTQSIKVAESGQYNVTVTNYITSCEVSSTPVDIVFFPLPEVNLGNDTAFCDGQSVQLDAGPGFTHYDWNDGLASSQQITAGSTGTWDIMVRDTNGCEGGDTINIMVNPNPVVELGPDTNICGTEFFLSADSGMFAYNWNSGLSFNPTLQITQTGTYNIVVTNNYFCTGRDTVFIGIHTIPVVDLGNDTAFCYGESVALNAGPGYVNYEWNNGSASQQIFAGSTGAWYVMVRDVHDCESGDTINIIVYPVPVVDLDADTGICGTEFLLTADSGMFAYNWNSGLSFNPALTVTQTGVYDILVTNEYFCTNRDTIFVSIYAIPVVDLGNDTTLCNGHFLALDAGAGFIEYDWNIGYATTELVAANTTGNWFVAVTDINGCEGGDTINIVVYPNPIIELGADTNLCGESYLLSADSGFVSYKWNGGLSLNPSLLVTQTGSYDILVTDEHRCTDRDTIFVGIYPVPVVELGSELAICGNSIMLDAGTGYAVYNWNNGQGSHHNYMATHTGIYSVFVTDNHGCVGFDSVDVSLLPLPDVDLGPDIIIDSGQVVTLSVDDGYASYLWYNGSTGSELSLNFSDSLPGSYIISVYVTDTNGCFNSDNTHISIASSIEKIFFPSFEIFPVPVKSSFSVVGLSQQKKYALYMTDINGKVILFTCAETANGFLVTLNNPVPGIYLLYLKDKNNLRYLSKIVVE